MAKLNDEVKQFIVQCLACFDTPSQTAKAVKEEFGLVVSAQQCEAYDPNKRIGRDLSQKWREVFEATRRRFLDDVSEIPIANRAVRLRRLQRMVDQAENSKNIMLAAQLLEQAAKESGGQYTNKQQLEHTGRDGGPIQSETVNVDEKALAAAAERLRGKY